MSSVNLHVLPAGPIQTNAYLLTAPARGEAILIDAPGGVWAQLEPILKREKCRLTELWVMPRLLAALVTLWSRAICTKARTAFSERSFSSAKLVSLMPLSDISRFMS